MFTVYSRAVADVEPFEVLKGASGLGLGVAARLTAGALAKASGTDLPTHIVMGPAIAGESEALYPAILVLPTTIFRTTCPQAIAQAGTAAALSADGGELAPGSGAFVVTRTENRAGGEVLGYFAAPVQSASSGTQTDTTPGNIPES